MRARAGGCLLLNWRGADKLLGAAMSSKDEKPDDKRSKPEPTFYLRDRTVLRFWSLFFLTVLLVLFLLLLWRAVSVLLLLFAGGLIAIALRFVSDFFSNLSGMGPRLSLSLVLFVLLGAGTVGGVLGAPVILRQVQELGSNLRESVEEVEEWVQQSERGQAVIDWIGTGAEDGGNREIWGRVAGFFKMTFGAITAFLLTLVVGIFFAYNPGLYVRGFLRLIPMQKRQRGGEILKEMADTLRWWMMGQMISMVVLAVSTWLTLLILGVPLAFILGLLTGLLTFIPYLGPLIALVPILLIAFVESPNLMLWVLVIYMIIQNLESNVLMPIIFQKTVHLPPVLTIVAQILLGAIFGFVGIVLATPLMAAGIDLVKMIYVQDVLGDTMDEPIDL